MGDPGAASDQLDIKILPQIDKLPWNRLFALKYRRDQSLSAGWDQTSPQKKATGEAMTAVTLFPKELIMYSRIKP